MVVLGGWGVVSYERGTPVGVRMQGQGFMVRDSGLRLEGFEFRVYGLVS